MEIFKILAVCLITAIFAIVLKEYRGDYALVLVLAGGVTVSCFLLKSIVTPIGYLKQLFNDNGIKMQYKTSLIFICFLVFCYLINSRLISWIT